MDETNNPAGEPSHPAESTATPADPAAAAATTATVTATATATATTAPRTLASMWGQNEASAPASETSAASTPPVPPLPLSSSSAAAPAPAQRKRRKKETGAQARLAFTNGAVGVVAPPPPPPPVDKPKKRQKRQSDDIVVLDSEDTTTNTGTSTPTAPTAAAPKKPPPKRRPKAQPKPKGRAAGLAQALSILSPESSPPPDDDVVVTGATGLRPLPSGTRDSSPIAVDDEPRPRRGPSGTRDSSPIAVDDRPPPPRRKIVFAADNKPAHSFFTRKPKEPVVEGPVVEGVEAEAEAEAEAEGGPKEEEEAVDGENGEKENGESTSKAKARAPPKPKPKAAVHSFFNLAVREQGVLKTGWGSCREGDEPRVPWPGGEWPAHVEYANVEPYEGRVARRERPRNGDMALDETDNWVPAAGTTRAPSPPRRSPLPCSVPPFILEHPAIKAVLSAPRDSKEAWCDAHRPRSAAAVLGNEVEATYLRDWLLALSVGSHEARRVIRRVPRLKAKNPDTDWIIDDLYDEPFTDDAYQDVPEQEIEPDFPLGGRPDSYPAIDYWIGNALLLTGTSGSGKTSAVYAAAAELGWDVFEVYPGIGKRTGTNLLALVGDVGKNHMVGDKKEKTKKTNAFFAPKAKAEVPEPPPEEKPDSTKQSLILIDEADILYKEESTFWPAIVKLIADSHRPVVITCNDLSRIPRDSLPIHTTLYFQPPPSYLAQPYLSAIAAHHGVDVDAAEVYDQCARPPVDLVDQPLPPNGHEPAAVFDLRAAITQMQLDRGCSLRAEVLEQDTLREVSEFADMVRAMEAVSFADAFLAPRAWARMETFEIDRIAPGPDDEDGHHRLLKPDEQERHPILAAFDHAAAIATAVAELGGGHLDLSNTTTGLQLAQTQYVRHILPALDEVVSLASRLLPHPTLFTETMPFLRIFVRTDDILAEEDVAAQKAGMLRVNRWTGRMVRGGAAGYERRIVMEEEGLAVVREGGLVWPETREEVGGQDGGGTVEAKEET